MSTSYPSLSRLLADLVVFLNNKIWSVWMLVLIVGTGLVFTIKLGLFQFVHFRDMWNRILDKQDSSSGISPFASFCTTMAMRLGTGNIAGVAVALYKGGPGAMFWMLLAGMTNSAVCFVECVLASLYKIEVDGEYRGGGAYCAERGLGWKAYGTFMASVLMIGASCFMPAAATYTICEGFYNVLKIPMWICSLAIALMLAITVIGGIKNISSVASVVIPFMTAGYLLVAALIIAVNITKIPAMILLVLRCAFSSQALLGGGIGIAIQQGVQRGTFSSASGMGESSPTAAATETSHPVKQGMANAAGVWLDTVVVCTCSGVMMLLTNCYNTEFGYVGGTESIDMVLATPGVEYVQLACSTVMGDIAPIYIAIMTALFSITCIISYYYEAETAMLYLFKEDENAYARRLCTALMQIIMPILVFIFGIIKPNLAWSISDLALGTCTWINMFVLWFLFPKAVALYKDYERQMEEGKDPYFEPEKFSWKGVDVDLWRRINKNYIDAER